MAKQIAIPKSARLPGGITNHGLFSNHYLKDRLPLRADWAMAKADARELFDWLCDAWKDKEDVLKSESEAQLESDWTEPILARLSYGYVPQAQDKRGKFPDYSLYQSDTEATKAKRHKNRFDRFYDNSLAILEGKRWTRDLDAFDPTDLEDKRNPARQILNYLRTTGVRFGFLTNGRLWRLYDYDSKQRGETYLEIDLQSIIEHTDFEAFVYFFYFFQCSTYTAAPGKNRPIEEIIEGSDKFAAAVSDALKVQVFKHAMPSLIEGFVDNNPELKGALDKQVFRDSLVYLYRLLFILYAESRELLPIKNGTYYLNSLDRVATEIVELNTKGISADKNTFRYWDTLKGLFSIIDHGAPMSGIPEGYNGGLFDQHKHPFLETNKVADFYLADVIFNLTSVRQGELDEVSIDYGTLKVRNLGTIYEGLLEHHAVWDDALGKIELENDKGERKATGSYYTPDYVVDYIVENTLGPLIEDLESRAEKYFAKNKRSSKARFDLPVKILNLKVCDPAMGSGHFLVAASDYLTNRILEKLGDDRYADSKLADLSKDEIKRRVVKHCIYGVDLNPMAVELAKLSLWLTTVVKNKPLSFLDHHLKNGNSLIGARLDELDRLPPLQTAKKQKAQTESAQVRLDFATHLGQTLERFAGFNSDIAEILDETLDDVLKSDKLLGELNEGRDVYRQIANLWISAYFVSEAKWAHEVEEFKNISPAGVQTGLFGDEARLELSLPDPKQTKNMAVTSKLYRDAVDAIKNNRADTLRLMAPLLERADDLAGGKAFFHWELEFPEVFGGRRHVEPGFDAVIGNPPYVRQEQLSDNKPFFSARYAVYHGMADIYAYFYEAAHHLVRPHGYFGMITSNKFMRSGYGAPLRAWLENNYFLRQLIDFGDLPVFPEATAYPAIFITQNEHRDERPTSYAPIKSLKFDSLSKAVENAAVDLPASAFAGESWSLASATEEKLLVKMRACSVPLGDFLSSKIQYGVKTGFNKAFFIDQTTRDRLLAKDPKSAEIIKPLLVGEDIGRYEIKSKNRYLIWTYIGIQIKQYPAVFKYLTQFQKQLEKRWDKGKHWWELRACDYYDALAQPKIVFPDIAATCRFALDREGRFLGNTGYFIRGDDLFLLALLNSAAVLTWYKSQLAVYRGGYLRFFDQDVKKIPIRRINFTTPEKERQELFA